MFAVVAAVTAVATLAPEAPMAAGVLWKLFSAMANVVAQQPLKLEKK
jgi:hypothetical protein